METLPIYYGTNNFVLYVLALVRRPNSDDCRYYFEFRYGKPWLQMIGPANVALLKHLDICFLHNDILRLSVDQKAYTRDLKRCLERYGITLPPETKFLAKSRGYWQPLEFGVSQAVIESRPRTPVHEKSLIHRRLEDRDKTFR